MFSNIFNCNDENSQSVLDDFNSYFKNPTQNLNNANLEIYLNGQIYYTDIFLEEVDVVVKLLRRDWCYLQNVILNNSTIPHNELVSIRDEINKCLKLIIESLRFCNDSFKITYLSSAINHLKTFSPLVLPIAEIEQTHYLKLASIASNKDKCPIYQYFHTFLDVKYYLFILDYISGNHNDLKSHVNDMIGDLISLSMKGFLQNKNSAFLCDCHKNIWIILQLLCENVLGEDTFWHMFNRAIENHDNRFILWLLKDIGDLQAISPNGKYIGSLSERIKPNYTLLETSLRSILLKGTNDTILPTLKSIEPLVCNLWLKSSKIEVYQILWDYFSKRLNMLPKKSTHLTMTELVELVDTILWTPKDCHQEFELFLSMLCTHLNEHPYHWAKMKGRIYSQLGPNKVKDLNNTGLFHVLLLFVSLTKFSFDELSKKFLMFIDTVAAEKKKSELVWSFYTSFIVRHVRENKSIEAVIAPFTKMLEETSIDHHLFHLIKNFVTDFDYIVKYSANLQLHQNLLISNWVHKYMTACYYPDLVALLNVFVNIIERVNSEQVWCDWEGSFKNYVYPTLKHVASSKTAPDVCGTLAAKITVLCPSLLQEAFTFFNNETIVPKVSNSFLCVILENYPNSLTLTPQQETVALQSWVKTCLLTRENCEQITKSIVKLEVVPPFIKTEIINAKDPLCAFIESIAVNIKQHLQSSSMSKFCENCFGQVERWIAQYLTQPDNEATVLRIYTCIGLAFYKIGPLLYDKHKAGCLYTRLVSSVLLPTELMVGKLPNPHVLQAMKKTWHLFFEATIKINTPNDPFIERTLREMVVKYIPHFAIADSPMLKCLDNEALAEVILDKMSSAFFKQPTKEAESNVVKSLKIIHDFVQSTTSEILLKLVVYKTLSGLFEVVMFHNQRNLALSTIKSITVSPFYSNMKTEFEEIIIVTTEKHLAFNATNYFELMGALGKFIPNSLRSLMYRIKQQISNVERMRGVGFDKNLRLSIERLEASLMQV